jgi:hypothetical protein
MDSRVLAICVAESGALLKYGGYQLYVASVHGGFAYTQFLGFSCLSLGYKATVTLDFSKADESLLDVHSIDEM